jgi:hypothetical protein
MDGVPSAGVSSLKSFGCTDYAARAVQVARDNKVMELRTVASVGGQGTIAHTFKPHIVTDTGGSP